jgi:chemotaxis-related protein WspD
MSGAATTDLLQACWKQIGLWGDGSCPELPRHTHCRNCAVFTAAATKLLDREPPSGYCEDWSARVAQPRQPTLAGSKPVVVFSIGGEWLALPSTIFQEVAELRPIHSLPHRQGGIVKGLVNIRGEILICVSLGELLGLAAAPKAKKEAQRTVYGRLLVVAKEGRRLVFPVDVVFGGHRYHPAELQPAPATVALASAKYSLGLLTWREHQVGVLDEELLFYSLHHNLA